MDIDPSIPDWLKREKERLNPTEAPRPQPTIPMPEWPTKPPEKDEEPQRGVVTLWY